ncbi:MAG: hypothetical protein ACLQVN_13610 [Bryobacteraceae bacterium]
MAADFPVRALEVHSTRMWRWKSVENAFQLMERLGLNTLIFHQNDLPDQLVRPRAYLSSEVMFARWPVRAHTIDNNRQYIRRVIREANRRKIRFFLEVKELYWGDGILDLHPEVVGANQVVCPTHPFWWEFERQKYAEVMEEIPDIAGVIVSPGTRESKATIATHLCTCDRCKRYDPGTWYANLFAAMYEPLKAKGKLLVVRDFAYTKEEQNLTIDACDKVSKDIVIALKNTPHDFYPTFPDNPRIGHVGSHPQWVEYDTWGQFYGLGFFPCGQVEDIQRRLAYSKQNGVTGVQLRTDWEVMSEGSVFNSLNLLNLFAGAMLARNHQEAPEKIYRTWLSYGLLNPLQAESSQSASVPVQTADMDRFRDMMRASWPVMEKTLFVRGHVFHDDGMFPESVTRAFDTMVTFHGRDDWDPGASRRVEPTDENIEAIIAEKEDAEREVRRLPAILKVDQAQLPATAKSSLKTTLDLYQFYVRGFKYCAIVCFRVRKAINTSNPADIQAAGKAADDLLAFRRELAGRLQNTSFTHHAYWLLDVNRLDLLASDVRQQLAALRPA